MTISHRFGTYWIPIALAMAIGLAAPARADEKPADAPAPAESGVDTVHVLTKDGKTTARKGEIVEELVSKVLLKSGGDAKPIKRDEIARIDYGGEPTAMRQAQVYLQKNDAEGAAKAFGDAVKEIESGKARGIFKPHALLGQGRALALSGKFAEAAEAFQGALKAQANWVLLRDATRECVRSLIRAGDAKKALQIATDAKAKFKDAELPEEAQDEAQLLKAEALEASGQPGEARSIYTLLTNSRDPKVKGRAALGAARAAFAGKDIERAEAQYRQIIGEKDVERSVRCGAARGLGDAIMSRPGAAKDFQKLRAAAAAYAQAVAVHFPARGEQTQDREGALHEGAKVYDALAELSAGEKDAKARELYASIARQLREELVRLYKTSQYRAENEQKLAKAGPAEGEGAAK
jgi:hypothetical protein